MPSLTVPSGHFHALALGSVLRLPQLQPMQGHNRSQLLKKTQPKVKSISGTHRIGHLQEMKKSPDRRNQQTRVPSTRCRGGPSVLSHLASLKPGKAFCCLETQMKCMKDFHTESTSQGTGGIALQPTPPRRGALNTSTDCVCFYPPLLNPCYLKLTPGLRLLRATQSFTFSMSHGRDDYQVPGSPFNDPPPRGASRQPQYSPGQIPPPDHIAFNSGAPNIYSPPPLTASPSYPPQNITGSVSTYSLTDSYAADSDEKGYRPVGEPEEESTPLQENFGAVPRHRGYQQPGYAGPSSAEGSYHPGGFSVPGSFSSKGSHGPQRGLTRKQTNAEAFRQRQQKLLGRSKTKKVVLKNGHLIT